MSEDTDVNETGAVDEGSELDPRTAATLLEQTKRRAQHQFEFPSPLLTLIQAGAVPAAGPLIVVGAAMAGYAAAREEWQVLGVAVGAIAVGAGSAFAGPAGVWGVAGAGICAVLVCRAIAQVWLRRS